MVKQAMLENVKRLSRTINRFRERIASIESNILDMLFLFLSICETRRRLSACIQARLVCAPGMQEYVGPVPHRIGHLFVGDS